MSELDDEITFEHDLERQSFEAVLKKKRAILEYRSNKEGKIFLTSVEIPFKLRDTDIKEKLILHVFNYIKENGMRMIPTNPDIKDYLKEHPEYLSLVASGIRVV
jgi:predicted GNAT family acetyltransferase